MGKVNKKEEKKQKLSGVRVSNSPAGEIGLKRKWVGREASGNWKRRSGRKLKPINRSSSTSSLETNGADMDNGSQVEYRHNFREPKCTLDDLKGIDGVKKTLLGEIIWTFANPEKACALKVEIPKGILLTGMPGTGKTCLADGIVSEIIKEGRNVRYYEETGAILDSYLGESEKKLRNLFQKATETAPSVIFFDELDGLGGKRGETSATSTMNMIVTTFLTEMNKIENGKVLIIAATNHPELCDQALIRPGRFDIRLDLQLPDLDGRIAIVEHYLQKKGVTVDAKELKKLCRDMKDFSGSDLKSVVERSWTSFLNRIFPGGIWRNMSVEDVGNKLQPGLFDIEIDVKKVLERMVNAKFVSGYAEVKTEPAEVIEISDSDDEEFGEWRIEMEKLEGLAASMSLEETSNPDVQAMYILTDSDVEEESNEDGCIEEGVHAHCCKCDKAVNIANVKDVKDKYGETCLQKAAARNYHKDVEELLRNGSDVDSQNMLGLTPLHRAATNLWDGIGGDTALKIIKALIDFKANVRILDECGLSFLHHLFYPQRMTEITPSQLHFLVECLGKDNLSEAFTPRAWDIGVTPLLQTVYYVDVEEKTLLLLHASGVDFAVTDVRGATVFQYAIWGNRKNQRNLFLNFIKFGANYKFVDNQKRTLLHLVAEFGNLELLHFVLTLDLDIDQANARGETPLRYAKRCGRKNRAEVTQVLIDNGASDALKDKIKMTRLTEYELFLDNLCVPKRGEEGRSIPTKTNTPKFYNIPPSLKPNNQL